MYKKALSGIKWLFIVAVALLIISSSVYAEDTATDPEELLQTGDTQNEEEELDAGTCGTNASWRVVRKGEEVELIISGKGAMRYYSSDGDAPWFNYAASITSLHVEEGITSVGSFSQLVNLETIDLPDSLQTIDAFSFYKCYSVSEIVIPESVSKIGSNAFTECTALEQINVPFNVKRIENSTFRGCTVLSHVKLPENLNYIGAYAFENCVSLKNIIIPNAVSLIDSFAFHGCSSLQSFTFPQSVAEVSDYLFYECSVLEAVSLPEKAVSIGKAAFANCNKLKSIDLPATVKNIGNYAFYGCKSLESVILPPAITRIEEMTFCQCTLLKNVTLGSKISYIGESAFSLCSSLESFDVPDSVTKIDKKSFSYCSSLAYVNIPQSVTFIGESAFDYDRALKYICYAGPEEEWNNIEGYESLPQGVAIYYNSRGPIANAEIVKQPENPRGIVGERVTVSVEATGDGLSYQWYVRKSETAPWELSSCTKASNSTKLTKSANGRQLYVVVTDKYGYSVSSEIVTITVIPAPKITEQPADVTGIAGERVSLKVVAEGEGLTYQWYVRASENEEWKLSRCRTAENTTKLNDSADGRQLYVVVTDEYGQSVESNVATLHVTVRTPLQIIQQPQDVTGDIGDKVTLEVEAEGDGLTYQ